MIITGSNFIGNKPSQNGSNTFNAINPQTGKRLKPFFYEATKTDINEAVNVSVKAFHEYSKTSFEQRASFLELIADEILSIGEKLLQRCHLETSLPILRLEGERMRTVNQLRMFAGLIREGSWVKASIDTANPERKPIPKKDIRLTHIPVGPVVVFGSGNFPLAFSVAGGDTASALAAGCPVIV